MGLRSVGRERGGNSYKSLRKMLFELFNFFFAVIYKDCTIN